MITNSFINVLKTVKSCQIFESDRNKIKANQDLEAW